MVERTEVKKPYNHNCCHCCDYKTMIEKDPEYKDAWCYMFKEEVFEKCMKYKYTAWEGMVITNE